MSNVIKLKRGSGSDPSASDLVVGELAIRTDTGKIFLKKDNGNVAEVSGGGGIADGDKGDITVSNSGDTFTIDAGVIADGNIASNAAIAGSKISPTFTSNFTATGNEHKFTAGTSGDLKLILQADSDNDDETNSPHLLFRQDGTLDEGAIFLANNEFNIASTVSVGGGINLRTSTTNSGYLTAPIRMSISPSGQIDFEGNVDCNAGLDVTGAITSTGDITITNAIPRINFVDSGENPDWEIGNINGAFRFRDTTNSATWMQINTDGHVDINGNLDVGAGLDVTGNITVTGTVDGRDLAADGSKLDGIAAGATNVTNNNQLTNGAGYITSADGGNAATLDGIDSTSFLRSDANDSTSGSITFSNDDDGIFLYGGGRFYKKSGSGVFIRLHNANTPLKIEDNSGTFLGNVFHSGNDGSGSGLDSDKLDGVEGSSYLRSDADDSFTGTITGTCDTTNPVLKIQGQGPNFIQFATDESGTVDADSINFVYRTSPNTLGYERASDATILFTVDADNGHGKFYYNLDVGAGLDVTGNITVTGTVDGVDIAARNTLFGGLTSSSGVLSNGVTATTQSAGDNSTKVATTAYTDTAISNLVDSSPSTLNTLNELAAALGDDANFSTTVTNSIATKLPKAGGQLTGNLNLSSSYIDFSGSISTPSTAAAIFRPADNTLAFSTANTERLRVTNDGATLTGRLKPAANDTYGLGTSSARWANFYAVTGNFSGDVDISANLTVDNGTSTTLSVKCDNAGLALIRANGDGQGTGAVEVGQSDTYGGGISYNGDSNPSFVSGEQSDHITFYRLDNGTRTEVFHYPYNSNTVNFNSRPTVGGVGLVKSDDTIAQATNASTLDSLDSTQFVRSDAVDTLTGATYTFSSSTNEKIILSGSTSPYIRFQESTSNKAYIQWNSSGYLLLRNSEDSSEIRLKDDITFSPDAGVTSNKIWHAGNDGSGSGLNADLLDGIQASSFARLDTDSTFNCNGFAFKFNFDTAGRNSLVFLKNSSAKWQLVHTGSGDDLDWQKIGSGGNFKVEGNTVLTTADYDTHVCHLKTNVDAAIAQGSGNAFTVNFNLEESNDTSAFSHSSGVVTVLAAGWYRIYANMVYDNATGSARNTMRAYVEKNGSEILSTRTYDYDRGASYGQFSNNKVETMLYLAANDTVSIGNYAFNEDGSVTIEAAECEFIVTSVSVATTTSNADTLDGEHGSYYRNASNINAGTLATARIPTLDQYIRSDANDTVTANLTFSSVTAPITTNSVKFINSENDTNYYTDATGVLAFDENFYSDSHYGTEATAPAQTFGSNGGGLLIKNEDGWGAILSSQNIQYCEGNFANLKINTNQVFHVGNDGSGSGLDSDKLDGVEGASYLRSDTNDTYSANLTFSQDGQNGFLTTPGGTTFHNVGGSTSKKLVLRNLAELRFQDGNDWNFDEWAGIKFVTSTDTMYIGGAASSNFTNNGSAANIDVNFVGLNASGLKKDGNAVWHAGNDGSGSGLDADTVDGIEASVFVKGNGTNNQATEINVSGYDFIVEDTDDGTTNFIWRDHSANKLFLGTANAVVTSRSHVNPEVDSTYNLGANGTRWANIYGDQLYGAGSNITSLNASNLGSGTVASARLSASTLLTLIKTVDGSGSGLDADTLDSLNSGSFVRNNADNDSASGTFRTSASYIEAGKGSGSVALTINDNYGNANIAFNHLAGVPDVNGSSNRIETSVDNATGFFNFEIGNNITAGSVVTLTNTLYFTTSAITFLGNTMWHAGNDGSGSGLDADKLDGAEGSSYLRADATTTFNASGNDFNIDYDNSRTLVRIQRSGTEKLRINASANTLTVDLYNSGALRFGTGLFPSANNTYDLGSSSLRWNNLYVNDMHFSNEGSQNSVDGSWGDWTLQEGENDIFMINNRSGKKFKIAMIPV